VSGVERLALTLFLGGAAIFFAWSAILAIRR
jgi:hypothetical protein